MNRYDTDDTIVALATPLAESALALIRVSGRRSVELVSLCLHNGRQIQGAQSHSIHYSRFSHPETGGLIDELTVLVYRAPRGYTGEDSVELICHGSPAGISEILEALRSVGIRDAQPGEFTFRAFLNGKLDLTQAEAVGEVILSKTRKAHDLAIDRLQGSLARTIDRFKSQLVEILSGLEIQLDYAEDEVEVAQSVPLKELKALREQTTRLLETYSMGRMYSAGACLVITGATNVGKSSLFNLIVKEDRAIVSDVHGTTRDYIEALVSIGGIPVRLFDTAGLRESEDEVESEGIRRSGLIRQQADLVIHLYEPETAHTVKEFEPGAIYVMSKADTSDLAAPEGFIAVSSVTSSGLGELEKAIGDHLSGGYRDSGQELMIESQRQHDLLSEAVSALQRAIEAAEEVQPLDIITTEVRAALHAYGELTGEVTSEEVLSRMFSGFCVGK